MKIISSLIFVMLASFLLVTPSILPEISVNAEQKINKPYTPQPGSPERKAIMDALREKRQSPDVVFVVNYLKVKDGWAWTHVAPQSRDGKSHFEDESWLLQKISGKWKAIEARSSGVDCEEDPDCSDDKRFLKKLKLKFPSIPLDIFPF